MIVVAAAFSLTSLQAMAHEGHDHEEASLAQRLIAQLAHETLPALAQSKQVSGAWSKAQHKDIAVQAMAGKDIWVVSHTNPDGKIGGQTLY